ncbi:glycosyltransferase family 4 protein [Flavobacteriaceae bacterium]|nr:glycosyltransferase family 4 protein [Flavobacteriaceae bacterium]
MISRYKVGIIVSRIDFGAAELLEVNLAVQLSKLGLEVFLLPQYSAKKFKDSKEEEEIKNYNIKFIRLNIDSPIKSVGNILKIRNLKLNFIISHNRGGDILGTFLSILSKTKHIKAFHEYYNNNISFSLTNMLWKISIMLSDFSYHISKYTLKKNIETFKLNKHKSFVIDNAIEFKESSTQFSLERLSIPQNKKIILSIARVVEYKGYNNNLDILIPILKNREDTIYVFAGDNSEDSLFFNKINERILKNNLQNKVFYLGQINNVIGLMKKSKVLLHFPEREGFGLILLEALLANLPIVASKIGGIPELLNDTSYTPFPISETTNARNLIEKYLDSNEIVNHDLENLKSRYSHSMRAKNILQIFDTLSN